MNHSNVNIKRLGCIVLCGCLFASLLPSPARADVRGGTFRVLEIVDDMSDAAAGWYISGEEPVDFALGLRSAMSTTERREYMATLGTVLQSRGLSGGEDCPLAFEPYREALPWEEHEGMEKLTLDHTEYASVRGAFAAFSGGGWSKYTEDGAEYVYMGEGAGEFTFLPSEYNGEVALCYYTVYTKGGCQNREFFKRAAFGLTYEQCGGVRVELSTRTAAAVTEADIDASDLILLCGEEVNHGILNYIVISGKASAKYPEGFSTAPVNDKLYSLCADVTPVALAADTGRDVTVLDIEPRTSTPSIGSDEVIGWFTADKVNSVTVECMSVAEFIGSSVDLIGTYDLIYIGASGTNIPLDGDGTPRYNDDSLNGYYYSAAGDKLTSTSEQRYTPFDLTDAKRAELVRYAGAGYPVVVADDLLIAEDGTTFSVTITENKRLFRPTTYTASLIFDDPASAPPLSEIRYQWYRSSDRLDKRASADTYIKGSNDLIENGSFQCGVTIGGSTAYSNAIGTSASDALPRSDGSYSHLSTVRESAVDPLSKMYKLLDDIKNHGNVLTASTVSGLSPVGPGLSVTKPGADVSRLDLAPSGSEVVATDEEDEAVNVHTYSLTIEFTLQNASGCTAKLYIDRNLDDSFLQAEEVTGFTMNPSALVAGANSLTYEFPIETTGLIPWKLVVTDGTHYDSQTGYAYIEPDDTREIRVLYRDAVPYGNLIGGDDFTFKRVNDIADCDVLVLSADHAITDEEREYLDDGGAVVYLKDAADFADEETPAYRLMPEVTDSVSYVKLNSVSGNAKRYSTDSASVANMGAVLRYPNVITDTPDISHDNGQLVTAPESRLPQNANVKLCLAEGERNTGEAFRYVPNDVRNDYFLYTLGNSVYLGLDIENYPQLTTDALKLLSNSIAFATLSSGGESSVEFLHDTMYLPADGSGVLRSDAKNKMPLSVSLPDTTPVTMSFSYQYINSEANDPDLSEITHSTGTTPNITTGNYIIPINERILAIMDDPDYEDVIIVTVTINGSTYSASDTMELRKFMLLPLK